MKLFSVHPKSDQERIKHLTDQGYGSEQAEILVQTVNDLLKQGKIKVDAEGRYFSAQ